MRRQNMYTQATHTYIQPQTQLQRYTISTVAEVQVNQSYHERRGKRFILPEVYIANYMVNDYRKKRILSKLYVLIYVHFAHK